MLYWLNVVNREVNILQWVENNMVIYIFANTYSSNMLSVVYIKNIFGRIYVRYIQAYIYI